VLSKTSLRAWAFMRRERGLRKKCLALNLFLLSSNDSNGAPEKPRSSLLEIMASILFSDL
jgi:hypothetical protein